MLYLRNSGSNPLLQKGISSHSLSGEVLLEVPQPFRNHNGGTIAFGPDGMLYLALGDGGGADDPLEQAQDLGTLLGSILRLRVTPGTTGYAIPADNPMLGVGGARPEIWAYGLRNPWRFAFDRRTGELWCGDVGQGRREEIDVVAPGDNCGWPLFEGELAHRNPAGVPADGLRRPEHTYARGEGTSVTGGVVYRGAALPQLQGAYVFADFQSGAVWALVRRGAGTSPSVRSLGGCRHRPRWLKTPRVNSWW